LHFNMFNFTHLVVVVVFVVFFLYNKSWTALPSIFRWHIWAAKVLISECYDSITSKMCYCFLSLHHSHTCELTVLRLSSFSVVS